MTRKKTNNTTKITQKAARRIQRHADKTGTNQSFKARTTSAANKKSKK